MKKWFALTMVICLLLAMTACAAKNKTTPTTGSTGNIADTTATTDSTGAITDGTKSAQPTAGTEIVDPTDGAETVDSTDETENRFALDAQYASSYLEATSNYEKCEVNRQFAEKWRQEAQLYLNKICEIADEDLKQAIIAGQTAWENTYPIRMEENFAYLQYVYGSGSIVPVIHSKYDYDLHRERAIELYEMYNEVKGIWDVFREYGPLQYALVLDDYRKIVQYRLSDDFLQSENLSALQQQLLSGLFVDAPETDGQPRWQYMIIDMLDYVAEPEVASFGYILKDLNGDNSPELIWVSADYNTVFAIFTIADNKAVLVDAYWSRYKAVILDSGVVYTQGSGGANTVEYTCWTLNNEQPDYKDIQKQFGSNNGQYYEAIDNAHMNISNDRFNALLLEHPFQSGNTWKNNTLHLLRDVFCTEDASLS